jgi:ABC-2 type transport system permease protein
MMRRTLAIARRELESALASPMAYVVVSVFTLLSGLFFSKILVFYIEQSMRADAQIQRVGSSEYQLDVPTMVLAQFFQNEAFLLLMALPLLTMGLVTEERRKGTIELLMTSPVRSGEIVAGKFLGAFAWLAVMVFALLPLFVFVAQDGAWEPGVVASGLLGLLLLGGAQIAIGLWISSLCESVLVSAIGTYGLLIALQFIEAGSGGSTTISARLLESLSFYARHLRFTTGLVAVADIVYFASAIVLCLFLAQRSIEAVRYTRT